MTVFTEVKVECHAGYKADEYPVCILVGDQRLEIREIVDRWYQGESNPEWPVSNYFKVNTRDGKTFILKHDLQSGKWYSGQVGIKSGGP